MLGGKKIGILKEADSDSYFTSTPVRELAT
jgi:hypothetical protein